MNATKKQKQLIHINAPSRDIKEELVQWATDDNEKTSCNDLDFEQANDVLERLGLKRHRRKRDQKAYEWGRFDGKNGQHKQVLSLCHQLGWTYHHPKHDAQVADLERLGQWLHSSRSPVQKRLMKMQHKECSKVITALESMINKRYK